MSLPTATKQTVLLLNSISYSWSKSSVSSILSDINLTVNRGQIFGLLGASGCGKTTLVRLILGRLSPSTGIISLLDNRIDGPRQPPRPTDIGYMPQDLVLYQEFTPVEMLTYFGRIYKLSAAEIRERIDFIFHLLNLNRFVSHENDLNDDENTTTAATTQNVKTQQNETQISKQVINQLSGGQKRRISLAIALLHRPRFLILDEPTVGVDPLLRETIWQHLRQLTGDTHRPVSVFLTTHYIEEARDAQSIGFLRNGRLLVQDSPENLLARFNTSSMEKVFLALCRRAQEAVNHDNLSSTSSVLEFPLEAVTTIADSGAIINSANKTELLPPLDMHTSNRILAPLGMVMHNGNFRIGANDDCLPNRTSTNKSSAQQPNNVRKLWNTFPKIFAVAREKLWSTLPLRSGSCTINHTTNTITTPSKSLNASRDHDDIGGKMSEHFICVSHLRTLMSKNFRQLRRNKSLLTFFVLLPAIEIALIMLCIGRDIDRIPIAVYNGERHAGDVDLSEIFLSSVPVNAFVRQDYNSAATALDAVRQNRAHALLQFSPRFSTALRTRFFSFAFDEPTSDAEPSIAQNGNDSETLPSADSNIWNESSVYVRLDMSNQLIGLQVQRQLLAAFLNFAQKLATNLGLSNHTFKPPIVFGPPVYGFQGGASAVVETFIAPGALIMIAFFATTIVTCHLLIHEVRQALIERALIAGASSAEFLFAHTALQATILMIQLSLMLFTAFKLFAMPYIGSLPLSICLIILQGLCGLMFGLMLSATCPDEIYATTLAIGTFFPSVIIGGIFWPVQSMPRGLQYLSYCLPSTQSIDALRSILLRDWNMRTANVAAAFAISAVWLCVFLLIALRNFKQRIL